MHMKWWFESATIHITTQHHTAHTHHIPDPPIKHSRLQMRWRLKWRLNWLTHSQLERSGIVDSVHTVTKYSRQSYNVTSEEFIWTLDPSNVGGAVWLLHNIQVKRFTRSGSTVLLWCKGHGSLIAILLSNRTASMFLLKALCWAMLS